MGISILAVSVSNAQAQEKIDRKVEKDCEAARDKYDYESLNLISGGPNLTKNILEAQKEMIEKKASSEILIMRCDLLNASKWKAIKSDYLKNIDRANRELKRIVIKYKLQKTIYLTCMKKGELKEISGVAPECPKGFKELYRK